MIKNQLLNFLLISGICLYYPLHAQTMVSPAAKISTSLAPQLLTDEHFQFIVVMDQQADVSAVKDIHGKEAKAKFIYEKLSSFAGSSQNELRKQLDLNQVDYHSYWIVNAILVKGDAELALKLATRTDVQKILANSSMSAGKPVAANANDTRDVIIPWGIDSIHAPAVWALGYKGEGAVVGGEDTGYDWEHPAIKNQYRGWNGTSVDHNYNWHDAIHAVNVNNYGSNPCGIDLSAPCDDYGHGTHTMGTMVGEDGDLKIGVAPKAKWIGERNMERGWGNLSGYLESFEWFVAPTDLANENPDPTKAPHVINNSWYCSVEEGCDPTNFSLMEDVVNNVKASGIVVVASAGNDGPYCNTIMFPPAVFESSFTIGAVDFLFNAAPFSSRGNTQVNNIFLTKPNVAAPGVDVLSCIPGNQYAFFSGTSMAGPHVAGTVALMISANPALAGEVDEIENILQETAQPATTFDGCGSDQSTSIPNNTFGFGIIDALAAVEKSLLATTAFSFEEHSNISVMQQTTNDILIRLTGLPSGGIFKLYTLWGEKSADRLIPDGTTIIHLSGLQDGIYAYSVSAGKEVVSGKILKHE
ncbi:MAG: S8 family serine peptidase [Chitinophagaceae bacterium]|nr:S8 family serine peptidase [Chitinophagaceae bacterium]